MSNITERDREKARETLNALAEEHGSETFVSSGYGYYDDAVDRIAQALADERNAAIEEAAKVVEDCGSTNVENPAIDMFERQRRAGIRWCGEWAAQRIRALKSREVKG